MKKLTVILAALLGLLLLCSCGGPELGSESTIEVNTLDGVYMEVAEGYTNRAATVIVTNDTKTEFVSDVLFSVQIELDGKWYTLENEYDGETISLLECWRPNSEIERFYSWNHMYGALSEGHYRIVKVLYEEETRFRGEPYYLAAEFYIGSEHKSKELWEPDEAPYVTVSSGGESIVPCFQFAYAQVWETSEDGNGGWTFADGAENDLAEMAAELPVITYGEDFTADYNKDSSFSDLLIYDADFERIYQGGEMSELEALPGGVYYVGIGLTVRGQYIGQAQEWERSGYIGLFTLEKP